MIAYLLALSIICSPASEKIEKAIKAYVQNNYPIATAEYQFDFHRINWGIIPTDFDSVTVLKIGKESPLGSTIFTLGIFAGGQLLKAVPVSVGVNLLVEALVTTAPINIGQPVCGVMSAKRLITERGEMPVTDSTLLAGMQAKNYITAGSVIYMSKVEPQPWIAPGAKVNIIIEKGAIRVTADGIARQKGGPGELIRVVNLGSKKIVRAEVVDSTTVAVR